MSTAMKKPTIVVSRCLLQPESDTADAARIRLFLLTLERHAKLVPVCPESEIRPRPQASTLRLVKSGNQLRLFETATGYDITRPARKAIDSVMSKLDDVDGFVLRKGSRFCGPDGVDVLSSAESDARKIASAPGFFAQAVLRRYPQAAVIDSAALLDYSEREHWLTAVFTSAEFQAIRKSPSVARLRQFHERYRTLLAAYHADGVTKLERTVQKATTRSPRAAIASYGKQLSATLARTPTRKSLLAPIQTAFAHLAPHLSATERKKFDAAGKRFLNGKLPLSDVRKLVLVWTVRYDKRCVRAHSFFRPYPPELA